IDASDSGTRSLIVRTSTAGGQVNMEGTFANPTMLFTNSANTDVALTNSTVLAMNGPQTIRNLTMSSGTLAGTGDLNVTGTITWTGGTFAGTGRIVSQGALQIRGTGDKALTGRTLVNAGTATWEAGTVRGTDRASFVNQADATFDIRSAGTFLAVYGTFTNAGTVRKSDGAGIATLAPLFNNDGTVEANAGTLSLYRGTSTGLFLVADGATLRFTGAHRLTADSFVSAEGRVLVASSSEASMTVTGGYYAALT